MKYHRLTDIFTALEDGSLKIEFKASGPRSGSGEGSPGLAGGPFFFWLSTWLSSVCMCTPSS